MIALSQKFAHKKSLSTEVCPLYHAINNLSILFYIFYKKIFLLSIVGKILDGREEIMYNVTYYLPWGLL